MVTDNSDDWLRRRNVVTWRHVLEIDPVAQQESYPVNRSQCESAAHKEFATLGQWPFVMVGLFKVFAEPRGATTLPVLQQTLLLHSLLAPVVHSRYVPM